MKKFIETKRCFTEYFCSFTLSKENEEPKYYHIPSRC